MSYGVLDPRGGANVVKSGSSMLTKTGVGICFSRSKMAHNPTRLKSDSPTREPLPCAGGGQRVGWPRTVDD